MNEFEQKYLNLAKELVLKHIDISRFAVFIFGSRADGTSLKDSDIDIGFLGNEPVASNIISRIYEEFEESIVPYHIDLVDFYNVDKKFRNIALNKTIIWNLPKNLILK